MSLIMLSVNYISNRRFISEYEKGVYKNSEINEVLGFTQPYISRYNQGNVYYQNGDYAGAEEKYRAALKFRPGGDKDCKLRINLALAIVKQIDADNVTKEDLDATIDRLEEAKDILIENGCAHRDDEEGHDEDAQTLKDEIDAFEEQLKQENEDQQGDKDDKDKKDTDADKEDKKDDRTDQPVDEEKIKKKLKEIQGDSLDQRNSEMDTYETYKDGYSFYNGQTW